MKNLLHRLLSLALALALCLSAAPALAAEVSATASTVQLSKTEGTVAVTNSGGKALTQLADMRLYNGNHVATEAESYAWLTLDSTKLNKLDAVSEVELRKKDKKLEVLLGKGNLYFNVTKPLEDQETLNIRTSTMVVGIRGTSGWVKVVDEHNTLVYILEGTVWCTVTDPLSGQSKTTALSGGETARFTVYDQAREGDKCDIALERFTEADIDGFVLAELLGDGPMCEKIYTDSGLDLRDLTEDAVRERLERDQAEIAEKLLEQEELAASQDRNISRAPVWAAPGAGSPASPGASQGSGSGSSGSTPSAPSAPSGIVRLTMPVTDMAVQQALNLPTTQQVVVSPGADPARNTLEIGISMDVAAGKTLTLEEGVPAQVLGGLNVDGTADIRDSLENTAGTVTVNSANTLRVGGDLVNLSEMRVTATGRVIVEGAFANRGALALTQGARALARVFMLTAGVPEWSVSDSPDEQGYYTLVYTGAEEEPAPPEPQGPKTITLELNNGEAPRTAATGEDGKLTETLPAPEEQPGEVFLGWFTEDGTTDPAKKVTEDTVFTEDTTIYAVWEREAGDFKVTGGEVGADYRFARNDANYGTLTVLTATPLIISMADGVSQTTTDTILVADGVDANITLDGVNIDVSASNYVAAFEIAENSTGSVTVSLVGSNSLKSGRSAAGLQKNGEVGTVTIQGTGSLYAKGGDTMSPSSDSAHGASGIGPAEANPCAKIIIKSGVITAEGGGYGTGIGGTPFYYDGTVDISGGTITGNILAIDFTMTGGTINGYVRGSGWTSDSFTMTGGTINGSVYMPSSNSSFTISGGEIISDDDDDYVVRLDCKPSLLGGTLTNTSTSGGYALSYISQNASLPDTIGTVIRLKSNNEAFRAGAGTDFTSFNPDGYSMDGPRSDGYYYLAKDEDTGDFTVTGGTYGTDYTYGGNILEILTDTPLTVSTDGTTTRDTIRIADGVSASLTLAGVGISSASRAPLEVADGSAGNVTITLSGENGLDTTASGVAALQKKGGSGSLTINGNGRLSVSGGSNAPGIGSGISGSYPISIQGDCYILAATKAGNALQMCIGTGREYQSTSGWQGVVSRASWPTGNETERIQSFTVYGQVTLAGGPLDVSSYPILMASEDAWLRGGSEDFLTNLPDGWKVEQREDGYWYLAQNSNSFLVEGGTYGVDYHVERRSSTVNVLVVKTNTPLTVSRRTPGTGPITDSNIRIDSPSGADVTLKELSIELDISTLGITPDTAAPVTLRLAGENTLVSTSQYAGAVEKRNTGKLTITGSGKLTARSGDYAAGIGTAKADSTSHAIKAEQIEITGCTVVAVGGSLAAGIGGGNGGAADGITITNASVTATGGYGAAGIGGGYGNSVYGSGKNITISNSTVTATGGSRGAGIGAGYNAKGSAVIDGSSVVFAVAGEKTDTGTSPQAIGNGEDPDGGPVNPPDTTGWNGLVVCGGTEATVYGAVTLTEAVELPADCTLAMEAGASLKGTVEGFLAPVPAGWRISGPDESGYWYLEEYIAGAFHVEGGILGTDYELEQQADGTDLLRVKTETPLTISTNGESQNTIFVEKDVNADITLAGVNINVEDKYGSAAKQKTAFQIAQDSSGNVKVTLAENSENFLTSGIEHSGLEMNSDTGSLTIEGPGALTAIGGRGSGSGIGGSYDTKGGSTIIINGGTIKAVGGNQNSMDFSGIGSIARSSGGTGIGSSYGNTSVTINGGNITAVGDGAPGIGAVVSSGNVTGTISITGGAVDASGTVGIGAATANDGYGLTADADISITGGTVISSGTTIGIGCRTSYASGTARIFINGARLVTATGNELAIGKYQGLPTSKTTPADTTGWSGTVIENGVETIYPKSDETAP